jgi:hypothetical protein
MNDINLPILTTIVAMPNPKVKQRAIIWRRASFNRGSRGNGKPRMRTSEVMLRIQSAVKRLWLQKVQPR